MTADTTPALTAEQALGVALSVASPHMVMDECQKAAPGMLSHLQAMGWTLARYVRDTGCEGLREALTDAHKRLQGFEPGGWGWDFPGAYALDHEPGTCENCRYCAALAAPAASPEDEDWMGPVVLSESSPATVREVPYAGMTFVDEDQPATASAAATSEEE